MTAIASYLQELAHEMHKSEAEVMALAIEVGLEVGLRQLWREHVLGHHLRGELTRQQAVETVGAEWVELAERQHRAMKEDIQWALGETSLR